MQVHGPAHLHGPQPVNAPHRSMTPSKPQEATVTRDVDQLDISREADLASRMRDVPEIRAERVAAIRAQIEAGDYETPDKLDGALDRLLDEIG